MHNLYPPCFPPPWSSAWGDDECGLWADLIHATHVQRFRWIMPGTFLMGSTETELGRFDDEGPQHSVTISQGFWLADTTCTQALWQAVTGKNPSTFKGENNPVEGVSWDDVQDFLKRLQACLPDGVSADLPTEAEWEYACRAGTETPFSFGNHITTEQVNYDGNHPYAGGEQGEYRKRTVAVKGLPANGWGLYQMHGNVWEWCADGLRAYRGAAETDPIGEIAQGEDARFAVRGGGWIFHARNARSAQRSLWLRYDRYYYLGFRFVLRSTVQVSAGGTRPEGGE